MTTCEDFPCCGHERGDCDGSLYGTDEQIMEREYARLAAIDAGYGFPPDDDE